MSRVTRALVESRIETVKHVAASEGIDRISYGGATYDSLSLYGAYDTWWLIAQHDDGGQYDVGPARGLRECYAYLGAMIDTLGTIRYTRTFRFGVSNDAN